MCCAGSCHDSQLWLGFPSQKAVAALLALACASNSPNRLTDRCTSNYEGTYLKAILERKAE